MQKAVFALACIVVLAFAQSQAQVAHEKDNVIDDNTDYDQQCTAILLGPDVSTCKFLAHSCTRVAQLSQLC